ncbi:WbqC family protein [Cyanobium sp. Aljojuca 7D2]|uniref:WbqC family protein n=1 Tax=Cyanobium sp. Aljojuca 7D2 TaxID=2823698 RepID=UPI0020CDA5D4|nr:WbqC family protein [Cyanobium sp. Aljojuca 7D2]MCP9890254.1 WbqC family protein [Cyanobium sp. Aljojuca 7D2]
MIVFISQSNYIPWRGFIDIIRHADIYVVYDSMQYTKNDWRNRNLIRNNGKAHWLTIPCGSSISRRIDEVYPTAPSWNAKHFLTLKHCYSQAPYWPRYADQLSEIYSGFENMSLSEINTKLIQYILMLSNAQTIVIKDTDIISIDELLALERSERLASLCRHLSADTYLTAPAAKSYLNEDWFLAFGIKVEFFQYPRYSPYLTNDLPSLRELSWVDPLMHTGRLFHGHN